MHGGADGTDTDAAIVAPADGGGSILVVAAAVRASTICRFSSGGGWNALRTQPEFGDADVEEETHGAYGTHTDAAVAPADDGGSILVVAAVVRASTICRFSSGGGLEALRTPPALAPRSGGDAGVPQRGRGDERNCLSKAS